MPRKPKVSTSFTDTDRGFKRMAANIGGMSEITIGVFGAKAQKMHSDSGISIGQVAAMHELGLGGMKRRSFVRMWMDENADKMRSEARTMMVLVAGGASRKALSEQLGKSWAEGMQDFITTDQVRPENAPATIAKKGHSTVMLGLTGEVRAAIGFKVKLPQFRSYKGRTLPVLLNRDSE